jgi:hypothetical protein
MCRLKSLHSTADELETKGSGTDWGTMQLSMEDSKNATRGNPQDKAEGSYRVAWSPGVLYRFLGVPEIFGTNTSSP